MSVFNFLDIRFVDIVDILLVGFLLFYLYRLLKGTVAINIFVGIMIIYAIWRITEALQMTLLSSILGKFISVGVFALIVVFQQEIRKFLLVLGSAYWGSRWRFLHRWSFFKQPEKEVVNVKVLVRTCRKFSAQRTGALIVIERNTSLDFVKQTGDKVHLEISAPILESIFFKNSPLHDGAIVVDGNYIVSTRVVLPVVSQSVISKDFGLRHRAAVAITEKTDAVALVVSEESGELSYIKNGTFVSFETDDQLIQKIEQDID